jgi:Heavy metal binding domain
VHLPGLVAPGAHRLRNALVESSSGECVMDPRIAGRSRRFAVRAAVIAIAAVAAVVLRRPLVAWFTVEPSAGPASTAGSRPATPSDGAVDHYTCSMHPSVREAAPGTCPICDMALIAVTQDPHDRQREGVVSIDAAARQLIGVRTEPVVEGPMRDTSRAGGHVALSTDLGSRVQVPTSAVVYTGPRRLVFVDLGEGRFRPTEVQLGAESGGVYEVVSGLAPGDVVATSGIFLIAAEARITTAAKYWSDTSETDAGTAPRGEP